MSSPTVRRRELSAILRALRLDAGLTVEQVARQLLCSTSKVSRMETGQRAASARDIRDLCVLYGIADEERGRLMALAREARKQSGWSRLPYHGYMDLEAEAAEIDNYQLNVVPGLLQTAEYAEALHLAAVPQLSADAIDLNVKSRVARQKILRAGDPPAFRVVLDEGVLRRAVGGPRVMRGQLGQILEAMELPHVRVQVIPYSVGALPVSESTFIILRFDAPAVSDVVYVESIAGDQYVHRQAEVSSYEKIFFRLAQIALSPEDTADFISTAAASLGT